MITVSPHRGSVATLEQVRKIKLVKPDNAGSQWSGVSHKELVDTILAESGRRGWKLQDTRFAINRHGADLAGAFLFSKVPGVKNIPGQTLSLGLLTSNARRKAMKFVVGTEVRVCLNGMVAGDFALSREHRYEFDVSEIVGRGLDTYVNQAKQIGDVVESLQKVEVSDTEASMLLVHAGRADMMPWSRIGQVDQEFRHPRFKDFSDQSLWSLFNAFTYVAKQNPPSVQMDQINRFRGLLTGQGTALAA